MESSESYNMSNISMMVNAASYRNSLLTQINTLPKSSEMKFLSKLLQPYILDPQQYYYCEQHPRDAPGVPASSVGKS